MFYPYFLAIKKPSRAYRSERLINFCLNVFRAALFFSYNDENSVKAQAIYHPCEGFDLKLIVIKVAHKNTFSDY
jgi:hypothetical protein